jgi:Domain of unknown function (DUF4249)
LSSDRARRLGRIFAFALVASAASCVDQTPVSPNANAVVVHAVLDASARNQYVIVQTTDGRIISQKAVSGAAVVIMTPDGLALTADEIHDSTFYPRISSEPPVASYYRISLDKYGIALLSGSTYRLHITLPDGREVTGSTTIPGSTPHAILNLPPSFSRGESLSLAWSRVADASAYEVSISSSRTSYDAFADTSIVLPWTTESTNGSSAFAPGLAHQIVVSAVDVNYYDYYRRTSDFFTGAGPITHLTGAVGVFGSIVPLGSGTLIVR